MSTTRSPTVTRGKAIATLAVVFLLGAGAGAALMRAYGFDDLRVTMGQPPAKSRARFRLRAMERHLDLSREQRAQIEAILERAELDREEAAQPCREDLDGLRQRVDKQIDDVLNEEQRQRYDAMMEKLRERRGRRHGLGSAPK